MSLPGPSPHPLPPCPPGVSVERSAGEIRLRASARSLLALVSFTVWLGSAVGWVIMVRGVGFPWPFDPRYPFSDGSGIVLIFLHGALLVPVLWAGYEGFWALVKAMGSVKVRVKGKEVTVFLGLGSLGYRRRFPRDQVAEVSKGQVVLEDGEVVDFGSLLAAEGARYLTAVLSEILIGQSEGPTRAERRLVVDAWGPPPRHVSVQRAGTALVLKVSLRSPAFVLLFALLLIAALAILQISLPIESLVTFVTLFALCAALLGWMGIIALMRGMGHVELRIDQHRDRVDLFKGIGAWGTKRQCALSQIVGLQAHWIILDSGKTLDIGETLLDEATAGFIRRVLLAECKRSKS